MSYRKIGLNMIQILKKQLLLYLNDPLRNELRDHLYYYVDPRYIEYQARVHKKTKRSRGLYSKFKKSIIRLRTPFIIDVDVNNIQKFTDFRTYRMVKEIWDNSLEFKKTSYYKKYLAQLRGGECIHIKKNIISNDKELDLIFISYCNLLISMNEEGYDSNRSQDDVLIWIGPNGELIKDSRSGRHRLAAAIITGVDKIPVRIENVHRLWIESNIAAKDINATSIRILLNDSFPLGKS